MSITGNIGKPSPAMTGILDRAGNRNSPAAKVASIERALTAIANQPVIIGQLDQLSNNLGEMRAGAFYALSTGVLPTDADANGVFMSAEGETFGSNTYHLGGVNNGVLQFGVNSATGKAVAGGGDVVLDDDGLTVRVNPVISTTPQNKIKFLGMGDQLYGDFWTEFYYDPFNISRTEMQSWAYDDPITGTPGIAINSINASLVDAEDIGNIVNVSLKVVNSTEEGHTGVLYTRGDKSRNITSAAPDMFVEDQRDAGTAGGSIPANTWTTRVLNTEVRNIIANASLSSNDVTLPPGSYWIRAEAPSNKTDIAQLRIYDVTNSATLISGPAQRSNQSYPSYSNAVVEGLITLAGETTIRLQHRCTVARATDGMGIAAEMYEIEHFANMRIYMIP